MRPARLSEPPAVVLVAHGSRDPRAGQATHALARALGPDTRATFLDHAGTRPLEALAALQPGRRAVLVPLLLTSAYHGRVDVPAVMEAARELPISVVLADVLGAGEPGALLGALISRLADASGAAAVRALPTGASASPATSGLSSPHGFAFAQPAADVAESSASPFGSSADAGGKGASGSAVLPAPRSGDFDAAAAVAGRLDAVVLAAAGTRSAAARESIVAVAEALGARLGLPCAVAYASASPPATGEAVERLRAGGARRVGVASYFLAPGLLYDAAIASALAAGAAVAAAPLTDHPDLVRLVRARVRNALAAHLQAAA